MYQQCFPLQRRPGAGIYKLDRPVQRLRRERVPHRYAAQSDDVVQFAMMYIQGMCHQHWPRRKPLSAEWILRPEALRAVAFARSRLAGHTSARSTKNCFSGSIHGIRGCQRKHECCSRCDGCQGSLLFGTRCSCTTTEHPRPASLLYDQTLPGEIRIRIWEYKWHDADLVSNRPSAVTALVVVAWPTSTAKTPGRIRDPSCAFVL